jgi:hypothetical protein
MTEILGPKRRILRVETAPIFGVRVTSLHIDDAFLIPKCTGRDNGFYETLARSAQHLALAERVSWAPVDHQPRFAYSQFSHLIVLAE